jgi:uncharacterized repeat protein (TIGR01451 family)
MGACLLLMAGLVTMGFAQEVEPLVINLADADIRWVGEDNGDWTGYFASPAGDVNGDGLGDVLIGAPMAGNKECPYPTDPCPTLPKGEGLAYLVLGRPQAEWLANPVSLANADASFLGCRVTSMTARQLYTAGDVNGDGYDDMIISGWKCGDNFTGKAYLILGRPDVEYWGSRFPIEQGDASFLGENEWDFLSYYVSTAGDVNGDGLDDMLISATHYEEDDACAPGTPAEACGDCCKTFLRSAEIFDPAAEALGGWTVTGDLNTDRFGHTAVLLADGRVLASGGQNLSAFLDSSEIFDPATGSWTVTGSFTTARSFHTAVTLLDGTVLAVGGQNEGGPLGSAEIFDPATGMWTGTGNLQVARSGHTMTRLVDGKVFVAGGHDGAFSLDSAEIFDPATEIWTATGGLNTARFGHAEILMADGRVLLAGGENDGGFLNSAEIFDPVTGVFTTTGALNTARAGHSAIMLPDGKVLVAGGENDSGFLRSGEIFDPATGTWTETEKPWAARTHHTTALLPDGRVLAVGGQNDGGSERGSELFDPIAGSWTNAITRTMNMARTDHASVLLPDGKLLVTGGRNCTNPGKIYLILGRAAADWGSDFDLAQADASFLGEEAEDRIGRAVSGVGDVNGDGYDDFLIGSISSDYGGWDAGQNYLFLGRAAPGDPGYDPSRPWWGTNHSVIGADASFVGEEEGDEEGRRVAWAGDVNGDGYDDFIIGAARNSTAGHWAGIAHLVLGRPEADWGLRYSLSLADASFIGEAQDDQAGRRLSGAGDVNNDGYDDFVIGAPHNTRGGPLAGAAYLIYGRPTVDWGSYYPLGQADVIYVGMPEIGVAGYDQGWLGDFDSDGIDDFIIAAYGGRNNEHVPGEVYLLLGNDAPVAAQFLPDVPRTYFMWRKFTTDYWNFEGWQDIASVQLVLGRDASDSGGINARYDVATNALHLWDSQASDWLGPCSPGEEGVLENDLVRLDCRGTSVSQVGSRMLRVVWRARWLQPIADADNLHAYLRALDLGGHDSGLVEFAWEEDVTVMKEFVHNAPLEPGEPLTYKLTFGNAGGTAATGVVITDVVPSELMNLSFESNYPVTATGGSAYTWLVADLAPQQGGVITLTGVVDPGLFPGYVFTNTATISATGTVDDRNNTAVVALTVPFNAYLPLVTKD